MKQLFSAAFIIVAAAQLCAAQTNRQTTQLDSVFSMLTRQQQFSGSVMVAEKGKIVLSKGYGFADQATKATNNPQTIFELASCSKQFTAAAIVLLKRQGKLGYEDKITKYLPELASWGKVSINDLLRHTSGLPSFMLDMPANWDQSKIATNADMISFYAKRQDTLVFEPKSTHRYNNTNYALLASIIERVSGSSYAEFLTKQLFRRLGMKSTFVYNRRAAPKKLKNYATGYVWAKNEFDKVVSEDPSYADSSVYYLDGIVGAAKVNSTTEDLLKWVAALNTDKLLSHEEFSQMTEVTQTSTGKNIPYGYGLDIAKAKDRFSFGHTGSWDGYASFIYHNAIKDRTIIVLENFKLGTYPFKNINEVLDGRPLSLEFKPARQLAVSDMAIFAGTYTDQTDTSEQHLISYKNGHLIYNTPKVKWDMRFFPTSASEFQAIRQGGADGVLRFTRLDDGRIKMEMLQDGNVIGSGKKI